LRHNGLFIDANLTQLILRATISEHSKSLRVPMSKSKNGTLEANIRCRGDYQYFVEIRRKGQTIRETFCTLEEARVFKANQLKKLDAGIMGDHLKLKSTKFKDLLQRYLEDVTPTKKGSVQETGRLRAWLKHQLAEEPISKLLPEHFTAYRDARRTDGRAPDTIRLELILVQHVFQTAIEEWGYRDLQNPVLTVKKPVGVGRERRLSATEERYLMDALANSGYPNFRALVAFAIETAMRQGELCKLTWNRVDLHNRSVSLLGSQTKNGQPRTVPLSLGALHILERLPHRQGLVFGMSATMVREHFPEALAVARAEYVRDCVETGASADQETLVDFHFHDLRHEATSRLVMRLRNLASVQMVTGHKTLAMLQRYTHLLHHDVLQEMDAKEPKAAKPKRRAAAHA
jgi:integrase